MQRKLYKICLWIAFVIFQLTTPLIATENTTETLEEPKKEAQLQELTFLVSPQDLDINQETITVHVNGLAYPVHSLKRHGNHWLAKVARINYCPKGHLTCEGCGQCHTENCWYYVRPCKLW